MDKRADNRPLKQNSTIPKWNENGLRSIHALQNKRAHRKEIPRQFTRQLNASVRLERQHPNEDGDYSDSEAAQSREVWSNAHDVRMRPRPKPSDPSHKARGLQPERAGRVRCMAWFGVIIGRQ